MRKFNPSRLGDLRTVLTRHVPDRENPGLVAMLDLGGDTRVEALGTTRDTIFRIASMTKPITAVATLILLEEQKLSIDAPVDPYLPELRHLRVLRHPLAEIDDTIPLARPITLRDLLTFRMGTGLFMSLGSESPISHAVEKSGIIGFGAPDPSYSLHPDAWIKKMSEFPLVTQPGERWLYNTAYYVLGVLLQRVTGRSLEAFFQERIFGPLGMKDSSFSVPQEKLSRLSRCLWFDSENSKFGLYDGPEASMWAKPPVFEDAAAGLVSTADDFLAFSRMLIRGGESERGRILSRTSVEAMTKNYLTPAQKAQGGLFPHDWDHRGFGYGVSIVTQRESDWAPSGQYGWDGGLGSSWRNDPKEGLIGIILTERTFDSPGLPKMIQDFWELGYASLE